MYVRLTAKHPDHPSSIYFDYLDVYKVVRATFSGNHLLDVELSLEVFHAGAQSTPRSVSLTMRSVTHGEQTSAIGLTSDGVSYSISTATPATGTLTSDACTLPCRNQKSSVSRKPCKKRKSVTRRIS